MGDIKGISYGVYLDRRIKPSRVSLNKGLKPREVCESICMAFGQATYEHIINNNFMTG